MEFIKIIGYAVCHQIPERSIFIDGKQLPVCARDTGLYLGSLLSLLFIVATGRRDRNAIPSMYISFAFVFFMLLLAIDGITSYLGVRATTNGIRLATGLLVGIGLPFFMYPLAVDNILKPRTEKPILSRWYELPLLIVLTAGVSLITYYSHSGLYYPLSILITLGIIALHFLMIATLVSFILSYSRISNAKKRLLAIIPLSAALTVCEIIALIGLHSLVKV
jgi:uncharacterized membrane protein